MNPLVATLLEARQQGRLIPRPSLSDPGLSVDSAYQTAGELMAVRQNRGERIVGRKIGFTNRGIWPRYGVLGPIWGAVYDTTLEFVSEASKGSVWVDLRGLTQPRLEPEIVFGLREAPRSDDRKDIVAAIEWVAHGFEIVQCPYADWKFTAADAIAAFGLHARLIVGPRVLVADLVEDGGDLGHLLAGLTIELSLRSGPVWRGTGSDVLDGPVSALTHLVRLLRSQPELPPLGAGEVVTTGTLTDAQPLMPGQCWKTTLTGSRLSGLQLTIEG